MKQSRHMRSALLGVTVMMLLLNGCRSMGIGSTPLEALKDKYHVSDNDFIRIKGIDIHYKDEGQGPVLILFHGICSSLYTWDGWVAELKDSYRIIRMDLPGWGLTGPAEDSMDLDKMIGVMEEFITAMGFKSFYMAGNSLGGYFAWNYAARHPEQVKKMILLDPVCYPQTPPWFIRIAKYPYLTYMSRFVMPKWMISMNVKAVYGDTSRIDDDTYDLYFDLSMRKGNKGSYLDAFRFMAQESVKSSLSKGVSDIKTPLLLMYGSKDKWVPPSQEYQWKKDVPGLSCIVYEGVGHVPMEEIPVKTARDAHVFFSKEETNRFAPFMDMANEPEVFPKTEQDLVPVKAKASDRNDKEPEAPEKSPDVNEDPTYHRVARASVKKPSVSKVVPGPSGSLENRDLNRF